MDEADIEATIRSSLRQKSAESDLSTSEVSERAFWADLIQQLCPKSTGFQACFDDLFAHFGQAENWRCFSDVAGLMTSLGEAGYAVAIASNFDSRLNSVCDGLTELDMVSHRIISSVAGWRKPSPEFYHEVTESLQRPADRILMVGDDFENDIQGATAVGMAAAWIQRTALSVSVERDYVIVPSLKDLLPALRGNACPVPKSP